MSDLHAAERERFEAWAKREHPCWRLTKNRRSGGYQYTPTSPAWKAWLARAALSAPAVPQWIPVSERLPTEHVTCALRLRGDYITIGWASYWHGARTDFAQWNFPHDSDADVAHEITHWMPLPAAPSAKETQI